MRKAFNAWRNMFWYSKHAAKNIDRMPQNLATWWTKFFLLIGMIWILLIGEIAMCVLMLIVIQENPSRWISVPLACASFIPAWFLWKLGKALKELGDPPKWKQLGSGESQTLRQATPEALSRASEARRLR